MLYKENDTFENAIRTVYDNIKLPQRGTTGSAGYDFFLPCGIKIGAYCSIVIPTGIRCEMKEGWGLNLYPRSGHGFKYGIKLANTVGIIDEDYAYADNEGHIMVKLVNNDLNLQKTSDIGFDISFDSGTAFCQGIFTPYGITCDDNPVNSVRHGGFGSTDKDGGNNV